MSPKKSKATAAEVEELSTVEALNVEAPAESGEDRSESLSAAPLEAEAVLPASLTCGPVRLTRDGKGYGWRESQHMPVPQASASVREGPHGWGAHAMLGQAGIAKSKATHPKPEQAAAELETIITTALSEAMGRRADQARAMQASARRSGPGAGRASNDVASGVERDLLWWCTKAAWPGADAP